MLFYIKGGKKGSGTRALPLADIKRSQVSEILLALNCFDVIKGREGRAENSGGKKEEKSR